MTKKSILFIFSLIPIFDACSSERMVPNSINPKLHNMQDALHFYNWLVEESKSYYDNGTGHFGQSLYGYRNVLNECYLRFDGYQLMKNTKYAEAHWLDNVTSEMIEYYKTVADTIDTGVWGFPAEINHPEFGAQFQAEIEAGNNKNEWIYELSGSIGSKAGIYYVHGQVLADVSKTYLRKGDRSLLPYIEEGANWIIEKNYTHGNINYFAAALKGLSYAFKATHDEKVLAQAMFYLSSILEEQNQNGSFGGAHDQEAGYHAITLSSLAIARKYLPEDELLNDVDSHLHNAITYLRNLQDVATEEQAGFVVQAWYYISCLADEGIISALEEADWQKYDRALQVCIDKKQELINFKTDNSYYFQKGVQTFSLIGSTIAKYYFGYHPEYY